MITLAEAVNLQALIQKEITEKRALRSQKSLLSLSSTKDYEKTGEVDELTQEIEWMIKDLVTLKALCAKANAENYVDFTDEDGRKLTIAEALALAQALREELGSLKSLASQPDKPVFVQGFMRREDVYQVASFDVEKYKDMVRKLTKKLNRLSLEIDRANMTVMINFDDSAYVA